MVVPGFLCGESKDPWSRQDISRGHPRSKARLRVEALEVGRSSVNLIAGKDEYYKY